MIPKKQTEYAIEFELLDGSAVHDKFAIASFGQQGSGKTRFAATMPSPIGVIPLDRKTRYTLGKTIIENGKQVLIPKTDLVRVANPMKLSMMADSCKETKQIKTTNPAPECCARHYYRWHCDIVKETTWRLAAMPDSECKSIVIDSGSQLAEDMLFANYGRDTKIMPRDRGSYNSEMITFLNSLSQKHLLITHKAKEIWKGEGDNAKPTGDYRRKGFGEIGYHVNIEIEHYREQIKTDKDSGDHFYIDVVQCQANHALVGSPGKKLLTDDEITFQMLALTVYPDSQPEDWE